MVEENYKKELDEMIANHKRLASDLVQKHDQAILMLRKRQAEAELKMRNK